MIVLAMAEFVSAIFVGISLISLFSDRARSKSSKYICISNFIIFLWLIEDGLSYVLQGPQYNYVFLYILNYLSYVMGCVAFISFLKYCSVYMREKSSLNSWVMYIPAIGIGISFLSLSVLYFAGRLVMIRDGFLVEIGPIPAILSLLHIAVIYFVPALALIKRKSLGLRAVLLLTTYAIAPSLAIIILPLTEYDYTVVLSAVSIVVVASILQREDNTIHMRRMNDDLISANDRLLSTTQEQAEQLEKIAALNAQLQEKQVLLEEASAEQYTQMSEIRTLNALLEQRMNIIQSMSRIYFSSYYIDIFNDTFVELSSRDNIRELVGSEGNAREKLMLMCGNLIKAEYADSMREFLNLDTIDDRMWGKSALSMRYIGATSGWSEAFLIEGDRDEFGRMSHVFVATRTIHDEKEKEDDYNAIIEGLSIEYHTVWLVDKENLSMTLIRSTDNESVKSAISLGKDLVFYNKALEKYISDYIVPDDRKRAGRELDYKEVLSQLSSKDFYAVNFMREDDFG